MRESSPPDINVLAEWMLRDYDRHTPGTMFADGLRLSLDEARRLQDAVANLRQQHGEQVVGYKIGSVSPINQQRNGLPHPIWGRLWSTEQHADGALLVPADFDHLAIEGEFALTLGRSIAPGDHSLATMIDHVECVLPVIELHNLVFRGVQPIGAELIANNAIHSGVVRGGGGARPASSVTTDLSIRFDDQVIDQWTGIRWPDDVLQNLGWLSESLNRAGLGLRQGQTILTGALGPPRPVGNVRRVEVTSSHFGSAAAQFVAERQSRPTATGDGLSEQFQRKEQR